MIKRLSKSKHISKIIVACTSNKHDKKIINVCNKVKIDYFIGSENNVLERFYNAAKKFKGENIVRVTSDCPLIDPQIVDSVIDNFFLKKVNYASNINPPTFPDGLDVEIFKFETLKATHNNVKSNYDKNYYLEKNFIFKNFIESQECVNKVGSIAESEGHHPDIIFGWGYAKIKIFTHAIKGLAESDFILAAKVDQL